MQNESSSSTVWWWIVGVIVALLFGCLAGTLGGGLVGYLLGREARTANAPAPSPEFRRERVVPEPELDAQPGVQVTLVVAGSPAESAGIRPGDVIVALDAQPILGPGSLTNALMRRRPGDTVSVFVRRGDRILELTATLGRHPDRDAVWLGIEFYAPSE